MQATIITYATPVFFLLIFIEVLISIKMKRNLYRVDDAINSIGLGILSQVAAVFTRILAIGIYTLAYEKLSLNTLSESSLLIWIVALIGYDFCYYWLHRFGHEFSILWAAHAVHHQSEEYNLSTALRQTSTGSLLGWIFYLPLAIVGIPPAVFAGVAMIDLLYQFWIHTQLIGRLGWFDHVFASPSNHRVHHAVNDKYLDKNYGGILIIWDKIFGTFEEEDNQDPPIFGTRSQLKSWNPLWANVEVYTSMLTDALRTKSWANKFRVLYSRTGWRPSDVERAYPKDSFELHRAKYVPSSSTAMKLYCTAQFTLILLAAVHFLQVQRSAAVAPLILYSLWILASLIAIGLLLEGRKSGYYVELFRCCGTGLSVFQLGTWFMSGPIGIGGVGIVMIWSVISLFSLIEIVKKDPFSHKDQTTSTSGSTPNREVA